MSKNPHTKLGTMNSVSDMLKVWQAHTDYEFVTHDVKATMQTMTENPHLVNVPVGIGGRGFEQVQNFYANYFVGHSPKDVTITLLSRTVGTDRVVDEILFSFTHDIEMPWILPGIAPTGKHVQIPLVAIVSFRDNKIESEHIYWDQASVLVQIGILEAKKLPILGAAQPLKLTDPAEPLNTLITGE